MGMGMPSFQTEASLRAVRQPLSPVPIMVAAPPDSPEAGSNPAATTL